MQGREFMPYPPDYTRDHSFRQDEIDGNDIDTTAIDRNFDDVAESFNQLNDNVKLIQRSDGELANESVGEDQLTTAVRDAINGGEQPPTDWDDISNKPTEFPPESHSHPEYSPLSHTHVAADITDLNVSLVDRWSFPYKADADRPILLFATGQSNMAGSGALGSSVVESNANVKVWQSNGAGGGYAWRVVDPRAAGMADYPGTGTAYCGMKLGDTGSMAYAAADYLQKRTGRDVYLFIVTWSGAAIANWTGVGASKVLIDAQWPVMIGTVEMTNAGITFADGLLWHQGESDHLTPDAWLTTLTGTVLPDFISQGYVSQLRTTRVFGEVSRSGSAPAGYPDINERLAELDRSTDDKTRVVKSHRFLTLDNVHFSGLELDEMGWCMGTTIADGSAQTSGASAAVLADFEARIAALESP